MFSCCVRVGCTRTGRELNERLMCVRHNLIEDFLLSAKQHEVGACLQRDWLPECLISIEDVVSYIEMAFTARLTRASMT